MIDRVVVFTGSKKDFDDYINNEGVEEEYCLPFMELIQYYNARIRPSDSGVKERDLKDKIEHEYCICRTDDYGSVLEHVLSNFVNIVCLNHDIGTLYVQNPPKKVLQSLKSYYGDNITYAHSEYEKLNVNTLKRVHKNLRSDVLGQEEGKEKIISSLYRLMRQKGKRPAVLMLYGPSGVGKTETAKSVSRSLGGELLRIQFSMMQTNEAVNYVFGSEHSKSSFARDLVGRETNVILIDEFDKVNPSFYNAFYELFDEGEYTDTNYKVDMRNSLFILTSNFNSEEEILKAMGPAMFSRIGSSIKYLDLNADNKKTIVNNWYRDILDELKSDEKKVIQESDILQWFCENVDRFNNIRTLKNNMEKAVYELLTEKYIFE